VTTLPTPEETAGRLDAVGETEAAALIRSMAAELQTVRAERDTLAAFTRSIAGLAGYAMSHNSRLVVQAQEALDALRVTRRCPKGSDGEHWWMRDHGIGSRCFSCHAKRPSDTPERSGGNVPSVRP
jgi:hypothetical protein